MSVFRGILQGIVNEDAEHLLHTSFFRIDMSAIVAFNVDFPVVSNEDTGIIYFVEKARCFNETEVRFQGSSCRTGEEEEPFNQGLHIACFCLDSRNAFIENGGIVFPHRSSRLI